jgi:hypothetical protein
VSEGRGKKIEMYQTDKASVVEASNGRLSISVPIGLKRRSGRCLITLPDGTVQEPRPWDTEITPLQSALARGNQWLQILESGEAESMRDIAETEGVDNSYVSRMINLTTLAPDVIEAILEDRVPPELTLFELAVDPPRLWCEQQGRAE